MPEKPELQKDGASEADSKTEGGFFKLGNFPFRGAALFALLGVMACREPNSPEAPTSPVSVEETPKAPEVKNEVKMPTSEVIDTPASHLTPEGMKSEEYLKECARYGKETEKKIKELQGNIDKDPNKKEDLILAFANERIRNLLKEYPRLTEPMSGEVDIYEIFKKINQVLRAGGYYFIMNERDGLGIAFYKIGKTEQLKMKDGEKEATYPIYHLEKPAIPNSAYPSSIDASAEPYEDIIIIFEDVAQKNVESRRKEFARFAEGDALAVALAEDDRTQIHHEGVHIWERNRHPLLSGRLRGFKDPFERPMGRLKMTYEGYSNEQLTELAAVGAQMADLEVDVPYLQKRYTTNELNNPRNPYHLVMRALVNFSIDLAADSSAKERFLTKFETGEFSPELFDEVTGEQPNGLEYRKKVGTEMYRLAMELTEKQEKANPAALFER